MQDTTLVIRLLSPQRPNISGQRMAMTALPQRDTGLVAHDYDAMSGIFSIDPMPQPENVRATLPQAWSTIVQQAQSGLLMAQTYQVNVKAGKGDTRYLWMDDKAATFYILASQELCGRAQEIITSEAELKENRNPSLIYPLSLLEAVSEEYIPAKGWMELDNGFLFFINYEMFAKAAQYLNVQHNIEPPPRRS